MAQARETEMDENKAYWLAYGDADGACCELDEEGRHGTYCAESFDA